MRVSHMLYVILGLISEIYTDLSFVNYDSSVPSSRRSFTPPSIGLLGGRGWLRDDALARRSIDIAGELISNCASGPNYFNVTHSAATLAAQETAFGRAGTLYGRTMERMGV